MRCPIQYLMSTIILYSLYEDFKNNYYSHHVYIAFILATLLEPAPIYRVHHPLHGLHHYSLSFSTAHPCPSWMTAFRIRKKAAYLFSTTRWWYFFFFITFCCWSSATRRIQVKVIRKDELRTNQRWVWGWECLLRTCRYIRVCVCVFVWHCHNLWACRTGVANLHFL